MKVVALLALVFAMTACIVKQFSTAPRLTGTCEGACEHYVECKPGHPSAAMDRCRKECPEAFSDEESLRGFESLSCKDTVSYVDGDAPHVVRTATKPSASTTAAGD